MKKSALLFFAILGMTLSVTAQWIPQNSGTSNTLKSIYFTDTYTGYAVGSNETILKTIDGGENWISQNTRTSGSFSSVFFTTESIGFVAGSEGIYKTTNGGEEWFQVDYFSNYISIFFPDINTGYAVDWEGVSKTTDGGDSWNFIYSKNHLDQIYFTTTETGYVLHNTSDIYYTSDGGYNWTAQPTGVPYEQSFWHSIWFTSPTTGFVVGEAMYGGIMAKTTDAGATWTYCGLNSDIYFNSIHFSNTDQGFTVGSYGKIYYTNNGGVDWQSIDSLVTNEHLHAVYFPAVDTGYIVGANGTILKTTNGGIVGIEQNNSSNSVFTIYPNPINNKLNIELNTQPHNSIVDIVNIHGALVKNALVDQSQRSIDVSELPKGIYFIRIKLDNGILSKKFIKQ